MNARTIRIAAAAFCAATTMSTAARADDDAPVRVLVAGPKNDPVTARLEKEITALGFAPILVGSLDACNRASVVTAVDAASAGAAVCSDGDRVGVWTSPGEGRPVELRDLVAQQEKGAHGREQLAMRAAEIMRANVALQETEPEPEPASPTAPPVKSAPLQLGGWEALEEADRAPPAPPARKVPRLTLSAGGSVFALASGPAAGVSFHGAIGVHRGFAITLHAEVPVGATVSPGGGPFGSPQRLFDTSTLEIFPGVAGVGVEVPFARTDARVIPRVGASVGAAWLRATRTPAVFSSSAAVETSDPGASETVIAPAGWATASLSVRIYGPLRGVAEGLFGSATGRLAVRDQGVLRTHWGTPIGGLAFRAEVQWP